MSLYKLSITKEKALMYFVASAIVSLLAFGGTASAHSQYHYATQRNNNGQHNNGNGNGNNNSNNMNQRIEQRIMLRSDMQEHAVLAGMLVHAELTNSDMRNSAARALDMNSRSIADKMESMYPGSRDEFLSLWNDHIQYYVDYANATENDDQDGRREARQNLNQFARDLANLLDEANSNYNETTLTSMFQTHGRQTLSLINSLNNQNYRRSFNLSHQAYVHMGMVADYLVR